ncbi:acyltransferase family protein [Brevibacterium yomogidense]|nr:acyltransferase family protein [Brevibacterium yomogidense]
MNARDHRLDAAKGVLILLVVFGHLLEDLSNGWEDGAVRLLLTVIYAFHMPAFVLLAGVTAKAKRMTERILTFVILLVVFQCVYFAAERYVGYPFDWSWVEPHWILWFLLAMVWWTLTVPIVERLPRITLAVSIAVGLAAGLLLVDDDQFSLMRGLVYWPFFVLGKVYGARMIAAVPRLPRLSRWAIGAVALVPPVLLFSVDLGRQWLYSSRSYDHLDATGLEGLLIRAALYATALLLTVALFGLVPDSAGILAQLGERSLSIFLLHGLVVIGLSPAISAIFESGYDRPVQIAGIAVCAFLAGAIALVVSRRPLHWLVATPPKRAATFLTSLVPTRKQPPLSREPARHGV